MSTPAPSFSSGSVTADGTMVTVTFDETLDNSAPPGRVFMVTSSNSRAVSGTASAVSISGANATFNLASALVEGETVTLAYAKPAGDTRIQDANWNPIGSLTWETVVNNTAAPASGTIVITKATYDSRKTELKVESTSGLGGLPDTSLSTTSFVGGVESLRSKTMTYITKKDSLSVTFTSTDGLTTTKPDKVKASSANTLVETADIGGKQR